MAIKKRTLEKSTENHEIKPIDPSKEVANEVVDVQVESVEKMDSKDFNSAFDTYKNRSNRHITSKPGLPSAIRVINTEKHGKRIHYTRNFECYFPLEVGDQIEVSLSDAEIAFTKLKGIKERGYPVRALSGEKVIYCASLIKQLTEKFNLDYSEKTSITFHEMRCIEVDGEKIAVVRLRNDDVNETDGIA